MTGPLPGDFGVLATHNLAGRVIRWGTNSPVNHAVIYVGGHSIMEAAPGGARMYLDDEYGDDVIHWSTGTIPLTNNQRLRIILAAQAFAGVPYGWLDLAAIALAQRRLGRRVNDRTWWARRLSSVKTVICSQLVDLAYKNAGVDLFPDRLPGLVSPGDLYDLITNPPTPLADRKAA